MYGTIMNAFTFSCILYIMQIIFWLITGVSFGFLKAFI